MHRGKRALAAMLFFDFSCANLSPRGRASYMSVTLAIVVMIGLASSAQAGHESVPQRSKHETFGGPAGVPGELRDAEEIQETAYRRDERKKALLPWYEWKKSIKEQYGLSFGINASLLYENASEVLGDEDDAAGGIYRLQGEWVTFARDSSHPGSFIFRIENRSRIGNGIPPASLRTEMGAAATDPGFAYSDNFGTAFSVLAWQQLFAEKRAGIAIGLLDFSAYVDAFYFQTIGRGFLNRSFILSPTLATTGIGALGALAKGMLTDNMWLGGGFYDANAKSGDPGFDDWDSGELLKHVEIGWTPSFTRRGTDRIQLTYWHKDALPFKSTPSGSGWLVSASWEFAELYVPFVRLGHSDGGGGALAEDSVSLGVTRRMAYQDHLTIGIGWNKPSEITHGPGLDTEKVLEVSYNWQITANTSLLPDIQLILDPAKNPDEDKVWVAGVRLRIAL